MRKHYMTMCFRGDTEVTYIETDKGIIVTYEQAVYKGFHKLDITLNGEIVFVDGFNQAEVDYYKRFTLDNKEAIIIRNKEES